MAMCKVEWGTARERLDGGALLSQREHTPSLRALRVHHGGCLSLSAPFALADLRSRRGVGGGRVSGRQSRVPRSKP